MSDQYIGEIRLISFSFAPVGWALCQGQALPIAQNQALFDLIGTTYGGDGVTTFALPDLRGRVPSHPGTRVLGQKAGTETATLNLTQMPAHTHAPLAASAGSSPSPLNNVWAGAAPMEYLAPPATTGQMASALSVYGGDQPHDNMLPFAAINFIIALTGVVGASAPSLSTEGARDKEAIHG